jgi:hypothetical protein
MQERAPREPRDDQDAVLDAAALLDIPEIEAFRLAYLRWYGRPIGDPDLEAHFVRYMFHGVVPPWVRAFTREVLAAARAGPLDPVRFGVQRRLPESGDAVRGGRYLVFVVVVCVLLVCLAIEAAETLLSPGSCLFPPCY